MARSVGSRTIDGAAMLRCMTVGLSPEQEAACRRAIVPVEVIPSATVREAIATMSSILPLVVVVHEGISEADAQALQEMATACSAEIVTAPEATISTKGFAESLLAALRVAELRRLGYRS